MCYSVAIDGPAGSGKSTVAKMISKELDIIYLDTGAMYRAVTLKVLSENVDFNDISSIKGIVDSISIDFKGNSIYLDGKDVSEDIRSTIVTNNVSDIAKLDYVRTKMVALQQKIASGNNIIMDGRDIGTIVLPDAELKVFLTASIEERARRRFDELVNKGKDVDMEVLKDEIARRDKIDSERSNSPLVQADDAILLDTSSMNINDVINFILGKLKDRDLI
ncbi:MAG: (d)CMP kinase [Firmicutes bacterium]|nr:(d)CMP kinase [Bacillota bacterium]